MDYAKFNEEMLETEIVEKLKANGWTFVESEKLERKNYDEPLLEKNLIKKIFEINKDVKLVDEDIENVMKEIKIRPVTSEGTKEILKYLKFGVPIKLKEEKILKFVQLIDYKNLESNEFIVSRQVVYHGRDDVRVDVLLYVNGIPLVEIELKNPVGSETWYNAYKQIKSYEKILPELYKYVQIGIAIQNRARYFPIVPWADEVENYEWKEDKKDNIDAIIEFLSRAKILNIIRHYILHKIIRGEETKIITRYMQYRAAEKIFERVLKNLNGEESKNKGLIWHWQGSGKTLIMTYAANKLYHTKELENPTIFFIVDRTELEEQLYEELNNINLEETGIKIIESVNDLKETLKHDDGKGERGLMITLIHKFRADELNDLQKELEEQSMTKETIMNRKNVILFIDEGHRSQYGMLAAQMKCLFKNAFSFAFTGTPISKKERDTYKEFCYPPDEKYMDKYFVTESLKDGFTVEIVYQPRLENEVHLKKDMLETFIKAELEELPGDLRENVEEGIKKRLNTINVFLENPDRIRKIAEDIKEHFLTNIDGKFKGMIVAASRKACVYYKQEIDKLLPKDYSEIIMTFNDNDDEKLISDYYKQLTEKYRMKDIEYIRKEIVEKFKNEEKPKILIVTDMLLAGFDAPILQVMYLDKPLKEHRLLQAIARVNRPYKDLKECGIIIDYVGILKRINEAFEMYEKEDWQDIIGDMNKLAGEFNILLKETLEIFKDIPKNVADRKILQKAVEILTENEENGKFFVENYKKLRKKFELLGSETAKVIHFEEYRWLSKIYEYYAQVVLSENANEEYVEKYYNKTLNFIRESTEIFELRELSKIPFDENYLKIIDEKTKNKEEKSLNLVFALQKAVLSEKSSDEISETLADKVEKIMELWREKNKNYEKIINECAATINERNELIERKKELGFSDKEYAILLILEKNLKGDNNYGGEYIANDVKKLFDDLQRDMFYEWQYQKTSFKNVERKVRKFTINFAKMHNINKDVREKIFKDLMEKIKK